MNRPRIDTLTIVGIVVAIISILVPIAWDYYKTESAIELQYLSFITLVEKSDDLEALEITYSDQYLDQISKADFVLINSGRVPIIGTDLISPIELNLDDNTRVLDVKIEELFPENLEVAVTLDEIDNKVNITFPLLNPDDYIRFSLLIDSVDLEIEAEARIVGITGLSIVDKRAEATQVTTSVPVSLYVIGCSSGLFLIVGIFGASMARAESKLKRQIANGLFEIPESGTRETYLRYLKTRFQFVTKDERKPIRDRLLAMDEDAYLSPEEVDEIKSEIITMVDSATPNAPIAIIVIVLSLGGLLYLLLQLS